MFKKYIFSRCCGNAKCIYIGGYKHGINIEPFVLKCWDKIKRLW